MLRDRCSYYCVIFLTSGVVREERQVRIFCLAEEKRRMTSCIGRGRSCCRVCVLSSHQFWTPVYTMRGTWQHQPGSQTGRPAQEGAFIFSFCLSTSPSFCGACLIFYHEEDSAVPFPRRPCSRVLCTHGIVGLRCWA
ncbi:unnamed protein product [Sphacelaria rigidula]